MEKINSFTSVFAKLEDSVIKQMYYDLENSKIEMLIEARDNKNDWQSLTMIFEGIIEIKFEEIKTSNRVIYNSFFKAIPNFGYLFDFSPYSSDYDTLEDRKNSTFYVICKSFAFKY